MDLIFSKLSDIFVSVRLFSSLEPYSIQTKKLNLPCDSTVLSLTDSRLIELGSWIDLGLPKMW